MNGDFSRLTFDRRKHYSGVRWQQGRVNTDADDNEAQDITGYRVTTETLDVIGRAGGPRAVAGFGLSINTTGDLLIGPGRYYVNGILCENEQTVLYGPNPQLPAAPVQPDLPSPPSIPSLLGNSPLGLVYLDVFTRHLTYHDDETMRDVALNGVDTTTRLQTVWQVKVLPLPSLQVPAAGLATLTALANDVEALDRRIAATQDPAQRAVLIQQRNQLQTRLTQTANQFGVRCDASLTEWNTLVTPPSGRLSVTTVPGGAPTDPCDVPPGGGYLLGENQLYTIQVHAVAANGGRAGSTFVWSRDNGSIVARIEAVGNATTGVVTGTVIDVNSVQRDDYLGIVNDDWVEYVDDSHTLNHVPGPLARVVNADPNLNRLTLDRNVTINFDRHPKLRKWNQTGTTATATGVAMNTVNAPLALEAGIQVEFTPGTYRTGDFWHFAARAVNAAIDFPPGAQPPDGIARHFARLGILLNSGGRLHHLLDCRAIFPPLTDITAEDVSFDNSRCNLPGVTTVQDAIDALCGQQGGGGTCTLSAAPGAGWERVFQRIPAGTHAQICLGVGVYPLTDAVEIDLPGSHLTLIGSGPRTVISTTTATALNIANCASVTLRDLRLVATGDKPPGPNQRIFGTLTINNCGATTLRATELACMSETTPLTACLVIGNDTKVVDLNAASGVVDIQDCAFDVGHAQHGAIIANGARIMISNCCLRVADGRSERQRLERGLAVNETLRTEVRRLLVADVQEGRTNDTTRFNLTIANVVVNFRTDLELARTDVFQQIVRLFAPTSVRDRATAEQYLNESVEALLLKPETISVFVPYLQRLVADDRPAMATGLMIGGSEIDDLRIVQNTIVNAVQGITVTPSRRQATRLTRTVITIEGNSIYSRVPPSTSRGPVGLMTSNGVSQLLANNNLARELVAVTDFVPVNGIHVVGDLGKRAIIRHNETDRYRLGILVEPERSDIQRPLWMVADNVASVQVTDQRVQVSNNVV